MKVLIIGAPNRGKTILANLIKNKYENIPVISIDDLRSSLGIYEPNKGYAADVAPENIPYLMDVIDVALSHKQDCIVKGYGLPPKNALWLGMKHNCPVVLLCRKASTVEDDFIKEREKVYKSIEAQWIKHMPDDMVFDIDTSMTDAYNYIEDHQVMKDTAKKLEQLLLNDLRNSGVIDDDVFTKATGRLKQKNNPEPIPKDRLAHIVGVAAYMYRHASEYGLDPEKMYIIGLLHDIGYISGNKYGHEQYGADLIRTNFSDHFGIPYTGDMYELIAEHGDTPEDYLAKHSTVPNELKLLWEANMSVNLAGEEVGYDEVLENICERYGTDSEPYKICKQKIDWLKNIRTL